MIVSVDPSALADAAKAEARRHPPRTPQCRAAAALWVALTTTGSVDAASGRSGDDRCCRPANHGYIE